MIKRRDLITSGAFAFSAAGMAQATPAAAAQASPLVGAWALAKAVTVGADGKPGLWMSRTPPYSGLIMYGPTGLMSVQMASARAKKPRDVDFAKLPADEQVVYLQSYYGYYGRYVFDSAESVVTHEVVSSLDPSEIGAVLRRSVRLEGDTVTLTTITNGPTHNELTWKRVSTLP
jgi:hypothetical protein